MLPKLEEKSLAYSTNEGFLSSVIGHFESIGFKGHLGVSWSRGKDAGCATVKRWIMRQANSAGEYGCDSV